MPEKRKKEKKMPEKRKKEKKMPEKRKEKKRMEEDESCQPKLTDLFGQVGVSDDRPLVDDVVVMVCLAELAPLCVETNQASVVILQATVSLAK